MSLKAKPHEVHVDNHKEVATAEGLEQVSLAVTNVTHLCVGLRRMRFRRSFCSSFHFPQEKHEEKDHRLFFVLCSCYVLR